MMQPLYFKRYGGYPFRMGTERVFNLVTGFTMPKYSPWKYHVDRIIEGIQKSYGTCKFQTNVRVHWQQLFIFFSLGLFESGIINYWMRRETQFRLDLPFNEG